MGRKSAATQQKYPQPISEEGAKVIKIRGMPQPRTLSQSLYMEALRECKLTIGTEPAGSGNSFLAMAVAIEKLLANDVSKIILTRPVVEAGENLGFLPGTLEEKIAPYLIPLLDALNDLVGPTMAKKLLDNGKIEFAPLAYMRGRSLNNCLPADHTVRMSDGSDIRLDDVLTLFNSGEKLFVQSVHLGTGEIQNKQILYAFEQPNVHGELVKITLQDGTVIEGTPDHKLHTKRGYIPMAELMDDDEITVIDKNIQ